MSRTFFYTKQVRLLDVPESEYSLWQPRRIPTQRKNFWWEYDIILPEDTSVRPFDVSEGGGFAYYRAPGKIVTLKVGGPEQHPRTHVVGWSWQLETSLFSFIYFENEEHYKRLQAEFEATVPANRHELPMSSWGSPDKYPWRPEDIPILQPGERLECAGTHLTYKGAGVFGIPGGGEDYNVLTMNDYNPTWELLPPVLQPDGELAGFLPSRQMWSIIEKNEARTFILTNDAAMIAVPNSGFRIAAPKEFVGTGLQVSGINESFEPVDHNKYKVLVSDFPLRPIAALGAALKLTRDFDNLYSRIMLTKSNDIQILAEVE